MWTTIVLWDITPWILLINKLRIFLSIFAHDYINNNNKNNDNDAHELVHRIL